MSVATGISVQIFPDFESLPERVVAFLDAAGRRSFFYGIPWFRTMMQTASPPGDETRIYVAEMHARPIAILVVRERKNAGRLKTHMVLSPSHGMYTSDYGPILDTENGLAGLREIVRVIAMASPPFDVLRFDSMDPESSAFAAMESGFRDEGLVVQTFSNFGVWFENVEGLTAETYLARRSSQLRYHIGRSGRLLARSGRARIEVITGGPRLESALADYERVDAQSWKGPEPYPECIPAIVRVAAAAGVLRLGILYIDGEPAAAQIWLVHGGRATIFRLSYAEKFGKLSVGTVLTFDIFRRVLESDKVREIDIGRGDDAYKKRWLANRREKRGLLVFNPNTSKGVIAAAKNLYGHAAMSIFRKIFGPALLLARRIRSARE
jgi:hypothetical protein